MNAFEQIADQQLTQAAKARHRAVERRIAKLVVTSERDAPMVASPADKASYESAAQFRLYQKYIRERSDNLLKGEHAGEVRTLVDMLADLTLSPPMAIVVFIENGQLRHADDNTRHNILALISAAIMRHRIRSGLSPMDDSMPFSDEPPTVFEQVRFILTGVGAPS